MAVDDELVPLPPDSVADLDRAGETFMGDVTAVNVLEK
jgi:hypothetical protein